MPGTQQDPADAVQQAGPQQLREVAVQPVRLLPHVLQAQQSAARGGPCVRAAHLGGEQAQAAAEGDAPRPAGDQGRAAGGDHADRLGGEQGGLQVLLRPCVLEEVDPGRHRSVQGDEAQPGGERLVQRRDVAEADQHLGPRRPHRLPVEEVGHALDAVSAAGAQHRVDGRVAPGRLEVGGPVGVGAREVVEGGVPVQDVRGHHRVEVPAAQHVQSGVQALLRHGTAGGDDGDACSGGEPGRAGQGLHRVSSKVGTPGGFSPKTWEYRESSASRARTMVSARRKPCPSPSKVR